MVAAIQFRILVFRVGAGVQSPKAAHAHIVYGEVRLTAYEESNDHHRTRAGWSEIRAVRISHFTFTRMRTALVREVTTDLEFPFVGEQWR